MISKDIYEELADMEEREDPAGMPATPEFIKALSLQFTPEEAKLAVQIGLTGGTLDELSGKTGVEREKLKEILYGMADKGTMWIDPGKDDPTYRVVGMGGGGLTETGLWGNIRFPYSVELGKTLHAVMYQWAETGLAKLGFPYAPVWAGVGTLPRDTLPTENIAEVIKEEGHWSVSYCPCRLGHQLAEPGDNCGHMLETCLHCGDTSRWAVEHGMAREITYEQAVELLKKCNQNGLVHTLNIHGCVCNCCRDCCVMFMNLHQMNFQPFLPSPFKANVDEETCISCEECVLRCPADAIIVGEVAQVNDERCLGCGVCVTACDTASIRLVRRPGAVQPQGPAVD